MKLLRDLAGVLAVCALAWLAFTCGGSDQPPAPAAPESAVPGNHPDDPPRALRGTLESLREARRAPRHPSDGAGRAWLEPESSATVRAGTRGRWILGFEAGPAGIAEGGFLRLTVPFIWWHWSPPQLEEPEAPGYTTAECAAEGVRLEARSGLQGLEFVVRGRALQPGERVRIVYGAGSALAVADRYAERESPLWLAVDGDGDGHAQLLLDSPTVEVLPGPAEMLSVLLPSTAEPGERVTLRLAFLDATGSRGAEFVGDVTLIARPEGLELPESVTFTAEDRGLKQVELVATQRGVFRLLAQAEDAGGQFLAQANPLLVEPRVAPVRWGDLHGHSNLSDGTGTPEDFLAYARDVAGLDVVCLTDHDHWGMLALNDHPELWERIRTATERANEPGRFVALLGYEWTSWIHGHRHVLYFGDEGEVLSSVDERYETPAQLWAALRGKPALTFAHHSAGDPVPTNWAFAPDPELEPVTEVASVHGSSESADTPQRVANPLAGNFVRDVLDKGHVLGFIGSGDSHDGHPGLAHLVGPNLGGVAALLTSDLTREGVRTALKERRCYATNGPRILLRAALDGQRMGSLVTPRPKALLYVRAIACAPIAAIELVRSGKVVESTGGEGHWDVETAFEPTELLAGEYLYVRVLQEDGGAAWSSPFFVR
ncbi:MAG TPA: CehA/McbA family metallohydrolase [Planctomycetota bacterium]